MPNIKSMTQFLQQTGANVRFFDMGRRVTKLSSELFHNIEQGQKRYPLPYKQTAWLALFLWNPKQVSESVVWFLKLPLDEQGFLKLAARDDILDRLILNLSQNSEAFKDGQIADALKDNPFSFTPDAEKMAVFHALASVITQQPASSYYEFAQQYFSGQAPQEQWQALGYQGIADLVIRHESSNNSEILAKSIDQLAEPPLIALSSCLENITPHHSLFTALTKRLTKELASSTPNGATVASLIRGISQGHDQTRRKEMLVAALENCGDELELIASIATRCHQDLLDPQLLKTYMEKLASLGSQVFSVIMAELMYMPDLRAAVMEVMRNPERSEALSNAIGEMFGQRFSAS